MPPPWPFDKIRSMYPKPFHYHRAGTLEEAARLLDELGEDAKLLAGGQSLIPLMKFRLAAPDHLVDLNFIPELNFVREADSGIAVGALARHAQIGDALAAPQWAPLRDCAWGIADNQVRNRGTLVGSVAEADPSGDWVPVLSTFETRASIVGPAGGRELPLSELVLDAYTTALEPSEVIAEVCVAEPPASSGGAYVAFKRSAQVYASASAAVHLTLQHDACSRARIFLGCVGLTAIHAEQAERELLGQAPDGDGLQKAAEAAAAAADPQSDMRGSADFKRTLIRALVKEAVKRAAARCRGEVVEGGHIYG